MKLWPKQTSRTLPVFMHPVLFIGSFILLGALFALQEWVAVRGMNSRITLPLLLKAWCAQYFLWGVFCWVLWRLLGRWLQKVSIPWMIFGVLPLSIVMSVVEEAIWVLWFPNLPLGYRHMDFLHRLRFHLDAEIVDSIVIFWCAFFLFRGVGYYQRFREKEDAAAQLEVQLAHAQIHALRMHLNPHFLFNTLNGISSLMQTDVAGADIMLEQFSSLLRITLERGEVPLIPLCDEMEFVEMYMAMQDRRFAGRVSQQIRVDPELHDALVPAMILQPIVENAYGHGLSRMEGNGVLQIEAHRDEDSVRISIINSGTGLHSGPRDPNARRGLGLANVKNRLRLHYPGKHTFSIREVPAGKVQVTVTLPLQLCLTPQEKLSGYGV